MNDIRDHEMPIYDKRHAIIRDGEEIEIHVAQVGDRIRLKDREKQKLVSNSYVVSHELLWDRGPKDYYILVENVIG